jgi:hypothetical protein
MVHVNPFPLPPNSDPPGIMANVVELLLGKKAALRIRIRMDPLPESAFQMRIPDANPDPATKFALLIRSSI